MKIARHLIFFLGTLSAMLGNVSGQAERSAFDQATLDRLLEGSLDRYIDFLQELLQIPNLRMQEHASVRFMADALEEAGCQVEIFEGEGRGEPTPDGPPINVFAVRRGTGGGRSLLLQAHIDTVPPGRLEKWTHGPWSGKIRGERIYGRGAQDDRTGVAQLFMVVDLLNQLQISTRGDLYLLVTTEEEFSSGGIRAYAKRPHRVQPDATMIVDGNTAGQSILGSPGWLSFQIRIEGAYGSAQGGRRPSNPIELMAILIRELQGFELQVRDRLKELRVDPRWPVPYLALTEIKSQGWIGNLPEECVARGFCPVIPPLTLEEFKAMFETFVQNIAQDFEWLRSHPPEILWGPLELPSMVTPENSEFFQTLKRAHENSFGNPLLTRYGGWGDLQLLGNTVYYGPGGGGGTHGYDEYYDLDDLAPTLKALVNLVVDWCRPSRGGKN